MSLVVFPFKEESLDIVAANLAIAAGHDRVSEVWAVGASADATTDDVAGVAASVATATSTPIAVFPQDRLGRFRSGKGDGMNTAIRLAVERGFERVHFYDADITNFGPDWIDGAESGADRGFGVVRHRFPRAATDAMITWLITRPGLALLFPGTILPRLEQPLGGEVLLTAPALEALATDDDVVARSDWGVDTLITHKTTTLGLDTYEHNAADGKRHALYGSLTDIYDMVLECLDAVRSLEGKARPSPDSRFEADPPARVPDDLKQVVGYDLDATRDIVAGRPSADVLGVMEGLGADETTELDAETWQRLFGDLMTGFSIEDDVWRETAFQLWVRRVLHYTTHEVVRGYDHAIGHLQETIHRFEAVGGKHRTA